MVLIKNFVLIKKNLKLPHLKTKIMNKDELTLYGDQLLVSVLAQFEGYSFKIRNESEIIKAFYDADRTGNFKQLFKNYTFDVDGVEIKSSVLEEAIDSLQQTRLLGRDNPDLKEYRIRFAVRIRYDKFIKDNINRDTENKIKELSSFVNKKLNFTKIS